MPRFGERLRILREERSLSQMELSKQLGISKSSINMYERGEREPSFETMELIADYFNVDMDYLHGKSAYKNKYAWLINLSEKGDTSFKPDATSDRYIKFALARGRENVITDEMFEEVQRFADYLIQREEAKKKSP